MSDFNAMNPFQHLNSRANEDVTGLGVKHATEFNANVDSSIKAYVDANQTLEPQLLADNYDNTKQAYAQWLVNQGYTKSQREQMMSEWVNTAYNPYERSWGEAFTDTFKQVGSGATNLFGSAASGLGFDGVADSLWQTADELNKDQSTSIQLQSAAAEQQYQNDVASGMNSAVAAAKMYADNPRLIGKLAAEQLPQLGLAAIPMVGGAALVGTNVLAGGGNVRKAVREAWENMPYEDALNHPLMQERLKQGMSFPQALEDVKNDYSDNALNILFGYAIGGAEVATPLAKLGKGINKSVTGTIAKEIGVNALQGGAEQVNQNLAVRSVDGKTNWNDDLGRSMVEEGIGGAAFSPIAAADAYRNGKAEQINGTQSEQSLNTDEQEIQQAGGGESDDEQVTEAMAPMAEKPFAQVQPQAEQNPQQNANSALDQTAFDQAIASVAEENRELFTNRLERDLASGNAENRKGNGKYDRFVRDYLALTQTPEVVRQAEQQTEQGEVTPEIQQPTTVIQGGQAQIQLGSQGQKTAQYEVVEADELAVNLKPNAYQNRDRTSADSQAQIMEYAANLNPSYLGASVDVTQGAPTVDGNYGVFAGNGRLAAIKQAYAKNPQNATAYRDYLAQNAPQFGFTAEQVQGMKQPVLVRKVAGNIDLKKAVEEGNFNTGLDKGVIGNAKANSDYISDDLLDLLVTNEDGSLNLSESNTPFISGLVAKIPVEQRPQFFATKKLGNQTAYTLTAQGRELVENALLVKAYSDGSSYAENLLTDLITGTEDGNKRVKAALTAISGKVIQTKGTEYDISADLVQAYDLMSKGKKAGLNAVEAANQGDLLNPPNETVQGLVGLFYSPKSISEVQQPLNAYLDKVIGSKLHQTEQGGMFDDENPSRKELLNQAGMKASRSAMKSVEANIKRGKQAMNTAITERRTVHRAMFNHELGGWVDFEWGDDGLTKPFNKKGEPVGKGIAHIIEARQRKDGMSYQDVVRMLTNNVVETIAKGEVAGHWVRNNGKSESIQLDYNGYRAGLIKNKGSNAWLLTAFELYPTGANSAGSVDTERATQSKPTLTRQGMGAVGSETVRPTTQDVNSDPEIQQAKAILEKALGKAYAEQVNFVRSSDFNDGRATAEGFFQNGKVHIVLDNIYSNDTMNRAERMAWVAWHEFAHNGIDVRFKGNYDAMIEMARSHPVVNVITRRIKAEYETAVVNGELDKMPNENTLVEEALVELYAATKTGNWAEIESRYNTKVHRSWKASDSSLMALFERIANAMRRMVGRIIGKDLRQTTNDEIFAILKGIDQGVQSLAKNSGNQTASGDTRYSLNERADNYTFGQRKGLFNLPDIEITQLTGKEFGNNLTPNELRKAADNLLRELQNSSIGTLHNNDMNWDFAIGKKDRQKMGDNRNLSKATTESVAGLVELVRNAVLAETHKDTQHNNANVKAVHRLYAPVQIGDKLYRAKLTVKDYVLNDGGKRKNLHAIETVEIENAQLGTLPTDDNTQGKAQPTIGRKLSVAELLKNATMDSDKEKGYPFADSVGLHLPRRFSADNLSARNVKTEADLSQYQAENSARYSFAGRNAKTANHSLLEQAERDLASGKNAEEIRQETGWFKGVDGKWRFEIDDSKVSLKYPNERDIGSVIKKAANGGRARLNQVINADDLFSAYPKLKDIRVAEIDQLESEASYNPVANYIFIRSELDAEYAKSTLLHEVQHAIQTMEQFAIGGNEDSIKSPPANEKEIAEKRFKREMLNATQEAKAAFDKFINLYVSYEENENSFFEQQLEQAYSDYSEADPANKLFSAFEEIEKAEQGIFDKFSLYRRLAGEVEARNVQTRMNMTAEERLNRSPESTEDVRRDEQIVRYADGSIANSLNENPNSNFAKAVDEVVDKLENLKQGKDVSGYSNETIKLGTTPDVFKMLGYPDVFVQMSRGVMEKAMRQYFNLPRGKHSNVHNLSPEALKQIPKQLNDPVAIYESNTKDGALVVLTELNAVERRSGENSPVIAALHFSEKNGKLDLINIASVYERNADKIARDDLSQRKVFYINKEKGQNLIRTYPSLQLASVVHDNSNLSARNVKTEADLSQYQAENSAIRYSRKPQELSESAYEQAKAEGKTELTFQQWKQVRSPEFKAWFGDWENDPENASKVINPKTGEPLVVYHGTGSEFYTFDKTLQGIYFDQATLGFYFTNAKEPNIKEGFYYGSTAKEYAQNTKTSTPTIQSVFLNIRKPYKVRSDNLYNQVTALDNAREQIKPLLDEGEFDGAISYAEDTGKYGNERIYVVPESNQIKSATDNNGEFSAENEDIRYSRKKSALDMAKAAQIRNHNDTFWQHLTKGDWQAVRKDMGGFAAKLDEWITDGNRPVIDWVMAMKKVSPKVKSTIIGRMQRATGLRDAVVSDLESRYLKPIQQDLAKLANEYFDGDVETTMNKVGFWISARWAVEKNAQLLAREEQAMNEAEQAYNDAIANKEPSNVLDRLERAFIKAENQYYNRKADVESRDFSNDRKYKVGVAGGWSSPLAQEIMRVMEKQIPRSELEAVAEKVYDLNQAQLEYNLKSGRYTQAEYDFYIQDRHYVPLTGPAHTPDGMESDTDVDFFSMPSGKSVNTAKDKTLKGRILSEADNAITAVWESVAKTATYSGWADFKHALNEVYEEQVQAALASGMTPQEAHAEATRLTGISKQKMQGTTRTNDNVLVRKENGQYYEYRIPDEAINALKSSNQEYSNWLNDLIAKPTRWYARGVTQFTGTFAFTNMIRDTWEKSEFIRVQEMYDKNGNPLSAKQKDAIGRALIANAVQFGSTWRATKRYAFGQELQNSDVSQRYLKELIEQGGLSTHSTYLAKKETDLIKQIEQHNRPIAKRMKQAVEAIEGWNAMFDTVSSLSAYKALREAGIDKEQAASITLELTNFRKTGSKLKAVKGLWMFAQPTAMGGRNLAKYLSTKHGQKRFAAYLTLGVVLYSALRGLADDDEGGNKIDQLGDIDRYIPIPSPFEDGKFIKIPVGFGMPQMAWSFATNMVKAGNSDITIVEAATNMVMHTVKATVPVSPSEISAAKYPLEKAAMTATPSIFQPLMQIALNRNAFGSQITTGFVSDKKLKAEQAKANIAPFWKETALWLSDMRIADMHPEQIKALWDGYSGMLGSLREVMTVMVENPNRERLGKNQRVPLFNTFYGAGNEFAISSRFYEAVNEARDLHNHYTSRKERGTLPPNWLTPERKAIVQWIERVDKETQEVRKAKAKVTKAYNDKKISEARYQLDVNKYDRMMEAVQRRNLYQWRKMQGLNTSKPLN